MHALPVDIQLDPAPLVPDGLIARLPEELAEDVILLREGRVGRGRIEGVRHRRIDGVRQGRVEGVRQCRIEGVRRGRVASRNRIADRNGVTDRNRIFNSGRIGPRNL